MQVDPGAAKSILSIPKLAKPAKIVDTPKVAPTPKVAEVPKEKVAVRFCLLFPPRSARFGRLFLLHWALMTYLDR